MVFHFLGSDGKESACNAGDLGSVPPAIQGAPLMSKMGLNTTSLHWSELLHLGAAGVTM